MLINFFETFSSSIGAGGLFDFNATLPFLALQFLILMFILNNILYNPLLQIISERNEYIVSNLTQSAKLIAETAEIKKTYETEILEARKVAQAEITQCQKTYKEVFDTELDNIQEEFDAILENLIFRLSEEKESALSQLEDDLQIQEISTLIEEKILLV